MRILQGLSRSAIFRGPEKVKHKAVLLISRVCLSPDFESELPSKLMNKLHDKNNY